MRVKVLLIVFIAVMNVTQLRAQSSHPSFNQAAPPNRAAPPAFTEAARPSVACATDLEHCPMIGCGGGDFRLNGKKNLLTSPTDYHVITFDQFRHLEEERPSEWKEGQPRTEVEDLGEGSAVMLTGYLYGAHAGSPETCNCKLSGEENNDYHLNIIENDDDKQTDSIVVEMTPKFRKTKPNWTLAALNGLPHAPSKQRPLVRVSGYLLFDSEHVSRYGGERFTIWEIHPITNFEYCPSGTCHPDTDQDWLQIGASP